MVLEQTDLAVRALQSADGGVRSERAVHETRKSIKRLRALLRLLRAQLGERTYSRENVFLRDLAGELAGARDAEVMLETFEQLLARTPKPLKRRAGVARGHAALEAERRRALAELREDVAASRRGVEDLSAFRARAAAWSIKPDDRAVARSARRLYESGRRRHRLAKRGMRPRTGRMHDWRKRVKDLRYAAEALGPAGGESSAGKASRAERWLTRTAVRADRLSERLGEEHDLAVLEAWVRKPVVTGSPRPVTLGGRTRKELLKLIETRRMKLRGRVLRQGKRLYRRSGKEFARELRAAR
jgi:CHAD domain-containing protein